MEREGVVAVLPRAKPAAPVEPAPHPPAPKAESALVGIMTAVAALLASRVLLLLALAGAFVLAVMAESDPSPLRLGVMIAFCLLTVVPFVTLDVIVHRRGGT